MNASLPHIRSAAGARPILIWGAGRAGVSAARYLRDQRIEPAGFIDSASQMAGCQIEGLTVAAPSRLTDMHNAGQAPYVVVASVHASEIAEKARALGVSAPADLCVLRTQPDAFPGVVDPVKPDFYALLHELRGQALSDMPPGARTILSAGCSGKWYFDWIEQRYGRVDRHIGAEAFLARPADLPSYVDWLPRDVANVPEVTDDSIDLVFSGQTIEHLWPEQVAGFLLESHRVLAPGGWLVLDSPNREITQPFAWTHPEHTIEYSIPDVYELLDVAGFGDVSIRGIWLCRDQGRLLPLSPFENGQPDSMEVLRRAQLARVRPESSFVWWAEARKHHAPKKQLLMQTLERMFATAWPERLNRFGAPGGTRVDEGGRWARFNAGERGIVAEGPVFPLRKGQHRLLFGLRGETADVPCRARLELTRGVQAKETLLSSTIATSGDAQGTAEIDVSVAEDVTFGFRVRIFNDGGGAGELRLDCHLESSAEKD